MSSVINAIGNARSNNVVYLYRKVPVPTWLVHKAHRYFDWVSKKIIIALLFGILHIKSLSWSK